ncbi:hypothetical protein BACI349Y_810016 [Bacillus sp. 349Y]|nr:hypothetical protein BACI349Y_810016 [Bacillus sp. 349Y]
MYKKIEEILNIKFPIDYVENFNKLIEFTSLYLPETTFVFTLLRDENKNGL